MGIHGVPAIEAVSKGAALLLRFLMPTCLAYFIEPKMHQETLRFWRGIEGDSHKVYDLLKVSLGSCSTWGVAVGGISNKFIRIHAECG